MKLIDRLAQKLALRWLKGKLAGLKPAQEVTTMKERIFVSLLFGAGALISALQINGLPTTTEGWIGLVGVFVTAAWGKFSSNTTLLAPDRKVWTPEERAQALSKS